MAKADHRQLVGFLNTADDLLGHLGHRLVPHMPALLSMVLRITEEGVKGLHHGAEEEEEKDGGVDEEEEGITEGAGGRGKELRTTGLRLMAKALNKFPEARTRLLVPPTTCSLTLPPSLRGLPEPSRHPSPPLISPLSRPSPP